MIKKLVLMLFIISFPIGITYSQSDYYSTGDTMSVGIKLVDGGDKGNSSVCHVMKKEMIVKYSPYEVKEFGFKDGRIYISKQIQLQDSIKKVFLERLYNGKITLYYYKGKNVKTFFIEKDSTLFVEIPKHNKDGISFHKQLENITSNCSNVLDATKLATYHKKALTKLIKRYDKCELRPFPHIKYGITLGFEFAKLSYSDKNYSEYQGLFNFKYDGSIMFGLFVDNPIMVSDFSVRTELYYSKHGYSYNKSLENKDVDFIANISTLKLPLLIRYTYPSVKFRPFINLGCIVAFNIQNKNLIYESTKLQNTITINNPYNPDLIANNETGWTFGIGGEYSKNFKSSLFFELRYNKLNSNFSELNQSIINITTGINF